MIAGHALNPSHFFCADIPLADLHVDFNEKIWTLLQPRFWRTRWPHKSAEGKDTDPIVPLPEIMESDEDGQTEGG